MLNRQSERPGITLTLVALSGTLSERSQEVVSVHNFSPRSVTVVTRYKTQQHLGHSEERSTDSRRLACLQNTGNIYPDKERVIEASTALISQCSEMSFPMAECSSH